MDVEPEKNAMTIEAAVKRAVYRRDGALAGRVADILRAAGWTYARILAEVQRICPSATAADWDDLLAEAEDIEARS